LILLSFRQPTLGPARPQNHPPFERLPSSFYVNVKLCHVDFAITAVRTGFGERRRLPRYPILPAVLIGRLAVDTRYQGRQIGSALIIDALRRSARAAPASFGLIVDAKDDQAAAFYRRHGFVSSLFLPIATALKLFGLEAFP
jgi:GNAT superfamily N-acetyltransferase